MKNLIKRIILESVKQYLKEDTFLNGTWFHGTNKDWDKPNLTVGEFDNMGGFFLSKNLNFAKGYGNIIKAYDIDPNADIFDVENKNHILRYAEQVKKEIETSRKLDYYPMPKHLTAQDYAMLLDDVKFKGIDHIEYFIKKAYPEIKTDVFNTVMDDGIKYGKIQYLIRNKRLYKDYPSIEKNDSTLKNAGFDGAYVYERGNKNIQLYKTNVITNIGKVNTNKLNEAIEGNKVICNNCGWSWNIKDGGKDKYVCHNILKSGRMCNHDNTPPKKSKKKLKELFDYENNPDKYIGDVTNHYRDDFDNEIITIENDGYIMKLIITNHGGLDIKFEYDSTTYLTNKNEQYKVANFIIENLKKYINEKNITSITFSISNSDSKRFPIYQYALNKLNFFLERKIDNSYFFKKNLNEQKDILNEKCWKGYTQKGMKTMFGKRYPNCVKRK